MKQLVLLTWAIAANLVLTIAAGCATQGTNVSGASSVPLAGTHWRLTQLGELVVDTPAGNSPVGLQLQPQNAKATGFAGCNRMFGGYALSNDTLRFEQMGATKMACVDESRMQIEQRYLEMFSNVARWSITGSQLLLSDAQGQRLAVFEAMAAAPTP